MSGITFTHREQAGAGRVRDSSARLPCGHFLTIGTAKLSDRVELGLSGDTLQSWMVFTAAQARSVAAELLACADARDATKGVHHG